MLHFLKKNRTFLHNWGKQKAMTFAFFEITC